MSIAIEFREALELGLARLNEDEWAIAKAEEELLAKLNSYEAFSGITGVLQVATEQEDPFCFVSCCWFVLSLARKADTSEFPSAAMKLIPALEARAALLGEQCPNELAKVISWFRLPSNNSFKADGVPPQP